MNPFAAWRNRLGLSKSEAARVLGLSRNSVIAYETGRRPLPRHVALACAAVERGIDLISIHNPLPSELKEKTAGPSLLVPDPVRMRRAKL